jgi:hypothetical protein
LQIINSAKRLHNMLQQNILESNLRPYVEIITRGPGFLTATKKKSSIKVPPRFGLVTFGLAQLVRSFLDSNVGRLNVLVPISSIFYILVTDDAPK